MKQEKFILDNFPKIINEYLNHMKQSELLKKIPNSNYIICIGLHSIIHIFKIVLNKTKNINITFYHCQKAYYCYLEYIEQMNQTQLLHNLKTLDAIIFIYKNVLNEIDNSIDNSIVNNNINEYIIEQNIIDSYLTVISFITHKLLFYSNEFEFENGEHALEINKEGTISSHSSTPEFQRNVTPNGSTFLQISDEKSTIISVNEDATSLYKIKNNSDKTIWISQIQYILTNNMNKYILLFTNEKFIDKEYLFDHIIYIKNHLKFDFNEYCEYLFTVYKLINKMKKIPEKEILQNKFNEYIYIEENKNILENLKTEKNIKSIVKILLYL